MSARRTRRAAGQLLLAAALVATTASCLRLSYRRTLVDESPPTGVVETLVPGQDDLATCLAGLGAPQFVWGLGPDGRDGLATVYAGSVQSGWNATASVPVSDNSSASVEFQRDALRFESLVLFFDADWQLERVREGRLDSILPPDLLDQLTGWDDSSD